MAAEIGQAGISERQFREIWHTGDITGRNFVAASGETINVVYPGRANDGRGADYKDAAILIDGKLLTGDVEFHLKSGDWRGHRHHLDPLYNRVILHVVMRHNTPGTVLQSGEEIPVLVPDDSPAVIQGGHGVQPPVRSGSGVYCPAAAGRYDEKRTGYLLDRAGLRRFKGKSERFRSEVRDIGAGESLYRGIMEALGYSGNKQAFLELAEKVPLRLLEMQNDGKLTDEEYASAVRMMFLFTAGLLSGENDAKPFSVVQGGITGGRINRAASLISPEKVMPPERWRLFRIRPCNSPVRRLTAMSYLLLRYREEGLLKGLLDLVMKAPVVRGYDGLEKGLSIAGGSSRGSYLGKDRAAEIAVNVLLPFACACGVLDKIPHLSRKSLILYRNYRRLETNSLVRHMTRQLGLDTASVKTAVRQQGLIHIYKTFCTEGRCGGCELRQLETRGNIQRKTVDFPRDEAEIAAGGDHRGVVGA